MDTAVLAEIDELRQTKGGALRIKYPEVFGEETRSSNRQFLFRRIAWRLQANVEGDLSERTRQRALEIANDADLRICAPEGFFANSGSIDTAKPVARKGPLRDMRLPRPGVLITRQFQDRRIVVKILEKGFEYQSQKYRSLSAIAREIPALAGMASFSLDSRSATMPEVKEARRTVRCAVYTRKSTEEGLEQEFNSLDAQREAAEAYIKSQRHLGWVVLPQHYDDGGFTGGNIERPALKRLLEGERTRDKMSAARRKGKWIGGFPVEAVRVREIFKLYAKHRSLAAVVSELQRRQWTTKS
jgi:hypothetical protein